MALHPEIKRAVRSALESVDATPEAGLPLKGELRGLYRYKVCRFRIIYEKAASQHTVRVVAIGHRRDIYDRLVLDRQP